MLDENGKPLLDRDAVKVALEASALPCNCRPIVIGDVVVKDKYEVHIDKFVKAYNEFINSNE